jgi:alpha-tubulin suppressor-like RCC1 family protein
MFTQVDAGSTHSCAVQGDGQVICWGNNDDGQLTAPAETFVLVRAGNSFTCGILDNGSLRCWGSNDDDRSNPPLGNYTDLATGNAHACALRENGTVACWGYNFLGQAIAPTGVFSQISAGGKHTCGRRPDGTFSCWGDNTEGQAPQLLLSPDTFPGCRSASDCLRSFSASGGTPDYLYDLVAGTLPLGLSLSNSGTLSGIPTQSGDFGFTIRVRDAGIPTLSTRKNYILTVFYQTPLFLPLVAHALP